MSSEVANELTSKLIIDGTKIGWHKDRVEAWMRGERVAPITMDIAWSRRCNAACIAPNALVTMGNGSRKPMSEIKAGDIVASQDDYGIFSHSKVLWSAQTAPRKSLVAVRINGNVLRCTPDHRILTKAGWVQADTIRANDVATQNGGMVGWRKIESISDAGYSPVYDLECVPYHNFVADGIVVHNCSFCAAKTQASASPSLDIPREKAWEFLEDAAEIGVKGISLISDGESTLVDYYAESIEYADKLGIKVGLGSNGIAFDRPMLERILPHVSYLRFNFSAGTRQRYSEIMGVKPAIYDKVRQNIRDAMDIVNSRGLECNVNMNLVCEPKDSDQLLPFAHMAKELGVHYAVIKHCATDDDGVLKVNYDDYDALEDTFKECERMTDSDTRIVAKWNRIGKAAVRQYTRCYGPPFILQMSGNGLIASCGPFFSEKYKAFHIGNIMRTRFRDIFHSERYWEVMRYLASDEFNPQTRCPVNCLQTIANKFLFDFKEGKIQFPDTPAPPHIEFI